MNKKKNWIDEFFLRADTLREFFVFLWERKMWWLIPMIVVLMLFAIVLVFAQSSPLAPFIYTLF